MNIETPLKVITGYDEASLGDIKQRYPITNDEWKLIGPGTEYVCERSPNPPRLDPWGRRFRPWIVGDETKIRKWENHSFPGYKYTRWTSVEGVPIKLVTI